MAEILKVFVNGQFVESKTDKYFDVFNPSTGEVIAKAPCCTSERLKTLSSAAKKAFPAWKLTPLSSVSDSYRSESAH